MDFFTISHRWLHFNLFASHLTIADLIHHQDITSNRVATTICRFNFNLMVSQSHQSWWFVVINWNVIAAYNYDGYHQRRYWMPIKCSLTKSKCFTYLFWSSPNVQLRMAWWNDFQKHNNSCGLKCLFIAHNFRTITFMHWTRNRFEMMMMVKTSACIVLFWLPYMHNVMKVHLSWAIGQLKINFPSPYLILIGVIIGTNDVTEQQQQQRQQLNCKIKEHLNTLEHIFSDVPIRNRENDFAKV